jgi:HK97 family phage prohead protease
MTQTIIRTLAEFRGINEEDRTAEFVISTESVDRHGTVFKLDGWQLDTYRMNPIVAYNHRAASDDPDDIIGTSEVYIDNNQLIGKVRFEEGNDKADTVFRKVQNGTLRMASVGAVVHEYRYGDEKNGEKRDVLYFTRQELLEWSIVTVGSNKDAFKRSIDDFKESIKPIEMGLETKQRIRNLKIKKIAK